MSDGACPASALAGPGLDQHQKATSGRGPQLKRSHSKGGCVTDITFEHPIGASEGAERGTRKRIQRLRTDCRDLTCLDSLAAVADVLGVEAGDIADERNPRRMGSPTHRHSGADA